MTNARYFLALVLIMMMIALLSLLKANFRRVYFQTPAVFILDKNLI